MGRPFTINRKMRSFDLAGLGRRAWYAKLRNDGLLKRRIMRQELSLQFLNHCQHPYTLAGEYSR
jgi:hypothetical protein